jgi:hypothetical protein
MAVRGMGGVLMRFMSRMEWGHGRISGRAEVEFSSHTRFEVGDGSELDSSLMCGVGIRTLR